jgi:Tfp pilus assembly protein PilO
MNITLATLILFIRLRPLVSAGVGLAAVLAAVNYPLWQRREAITAEHERARRNGDLMLHSLANRTHIETDVAALRAALGQIERDLVDERSMEVNLGYFYKLERTTRVRLVRLNQLVSSPPAAGSPFKAVPFALQFAGSYRNSMGFLRALETGPRILRVRNCSFERVAPDSSDLVVDLTVDLLARP